MTKIVKCSMCQAEQEMTKMISQENRDEEGKYYTFYCETCFKRKHNEEGVKWQ